jgi:hypothetical protein
MVATHSLNSYTVKAGLHGARQVNKYLAPSYLLRVDINLLKFWGTASNKLMSTRSQ